MSSKSTRRGFLRGSVTAAVVGSGCAHDSTPATELAKTSGASARPGVPTVKIETEVNGRTHALDVGPDETALDVVRARLDLTGGKLGCGHGSCGACTMQLDGTPVATCILPATALHRAKVTTVEGIASGSTLHAVQRAFMAEDGLQCGYCTPGFIVEAAAFVDHWREEHGRTTPDRDQVAAALCGHLCRCGAYDAIYRAVQGACAGHYDEEQRHGPRYDGREKVTGEARYTVDIKLPGMLHARALHSPYAHAEVTRLDWSKALAIPGVRAVVEMLGPRRILRYAGQEIVALAAVDEETARRGLAAVEIEYDVRPPLLDMETARAAGAAPIYARHSERKHPPSSAEGLVPPASWKANVRGPFKLFSKQAGKARRAIEDARTGKGQLAQGRFTTAVQSHTCLEPHAAVAQWDGDDGLTLYLSTQAVSHMQREVADRWGLRRDRVRVLAHYVGGGFGTKATLTTEAVIAVELARACRAPVRYALGRREEIMIGGNRPGTEVDIALATNDDGDLTGVTADIHSNSGVAVGHVVGPMMRIIYPKAPKQLVDYEVVTHGPPGRPFRGPGGPQAYWPLEQAIDDIAHQRGEDPLEVRHRWDPNPARQPLYTWAQGIDAWAHRPPHQSDKGRFRRGIGVACAAWFAFAEPVSRVQIETGPDGVVVSTAAQDMGNGTRTVLADVVARELRLSRDQIDVRVGDSNYVPGPMSGGSRTTSSLVPAVVHACEQIKEELLDVAEARYGLRHPVATEAGVDAGARRIPWHEVMKVSPPMTVVGRRRRDKGGFVLFPIEGLGVERYISSSIQIVEAEVDTRLGRVTVRRAWGGFGVGKIVSPVLARSQAQGGILQSISYALYEERRLDPTDGFLLTGGLEDYRIAGIGDAPAEVDVFFSERGYEKVRGRSIGLGELVTLAPAAAIGNAVFNATGWRPRDLPIRPDRVLEGLRA